ncbi:MAG: phospholipid carrier-dependent glycosyltransferase [Anaerolineae bacterium]|nr:phospholipid carrier-dependent glycosyltransferase [Anaerolineae bacterium]
MSSLAKYAPPLCILLCFLGLALHTAQVVPAFENSDEAEHFLYANTIAERGVLPRILPRDALNDADSALERWNNHAHHPPLYYLSAALFINGFDRSDLATYLRTNDLIFTRGVTTNNPNKWLHSPQPPLDQTLFALKVARWFNIALGLLTLSLIYKMAHIVTHNRYVALLAMGFVASIPTFISIHSSVSNDPLVVMLFSAGILWSVRLLRRRRLTWQDDNLIGLILAGAALSKLTGAALWAVVLMALAIAVLNKWLAFGRALRTVAIALLMFAVLAGWWYLRNWQLYGDPLALDATAAMWGRDFDVVATSFAGELQRLALSFWMMVGYKHEPIFAPDWFYTVNAAIVGLAILGAFFRRRISISKWDACLLITTIAVVMALVAIGTVNVDISYGRLLMPAIAAISIFIAWGLARLPFLSGTLAIFVFFISSAIVLAIDLPSHYRTLLVVESVPATATPTDWQLDALTMIGIELHSQTIQPGEILTFDLYLHGNSSSNPALSATLVDSLSSAVMGQIDVFPGMAPTDSLDGDLIYRATLNVPIEESDEPLPPRALMLQLRWYDVDNAEWLDFTIGNGILEGAALLVDPRYEGPKFDQEASAQFGDLISLTSFDVNPTHANPDDTITLNLAWMLRGQPEKDMVLTVQLYDADGQFVTQWDGALAGIPYWLWQDGIHVPDSRQLPLPDDLTPGEYQIRLGWYDLDTVSRLPVDGPQRDNLAILPTTLTIDR